MIIAKKKICTVCKKELVEGNFYKTRNKLFIDGRTPICKNCIKDQIDYTDINTVYNLLRQMDVPFIYNYWDKAEKGVKETFGSYMRMASTLKQFNNKTWEDSVFKQEKIVKKSNKSKIKNYQYTEKELNNYKEKYGEGYDDKEYILFEKKYQQLKPSFQLLTSMHEECLADYCIDKVKAGLAKAKGDFNQAKEWEKMAKDVATSGKLNPSQMSKADLSGGLDCFSQLARMIEQTDEGEVISILPMFTERPKDKVDVNLWCFINNIRDVKGLPEVEYKEIYKWYDKRKKDYESQMLDNSIKKESVNENE